MVIVLGLIAFIVLMSFAGFMEWRAHKRKKAHGRSRVKSGVHRRDHKRRD